MKTTKERITNRSIRTVAAIALAVAMAITSIQAGVVADFPISSFTGGISGFGSGSYRPAQTFVALGSGELDTISVALAQNGSVLPNHVVVEFRSTAAGTPSSSILASSTINGSLFAGVQPGSPVMLTASFSSYHIGLTSGSTYAFSLRTDDSGYAFACGSGAYIVYNYPGGSLFDSSSSGTTWTAQPLYDMNFQVTSVPEPSALVLIGLGALAALRAGGLSQRDNRYLGGCAPNRSPAEISVDK